MHNFELKLASGNIQLRWDTTAMLIFCRKFGENGKALPLAKMLELYDSSVFSLEHIIAFFQAGFESANDKELGEKEAARMIDEAGGLNNTDSQALAFVRYCNGQHETDLTGDQEEKKSE